MRVETDILCQRCKYNLRTLDEMVNCPECNTPVADTLRVVDLGEYGRGPTRRLQLTLSAPCLVLIPIADLIAVLGTGDFLRVVLWGDRGERATAWGQLMFVGVGAIGAAFLAVIGAALTLPRDLQRWQVHGLDSRCRRRRLFFIIHIPLIALPYVLGMFARLVKTFGLGGM